jgi:Ca-activated chloride channel family protein
MKELFDRHQERLTDAEDRRVWGAVYDEVKRRRPVWKRWGISLSVFATVTAAVVVVAVVNQPGMQRGNAPGLDIVASAEREQEPATPSELQGEGVLNSPDKKNQERSLFKPEGQYDTNERSLDDRLMEMPSDASEAARLEARGRVHPPTPVQVEFGILGGEADDAQARGKRSDQDALAGGAAGEEVASNVPARKAKREAQISSGVINGRVTTAQGEPLRFANVMIEGTDMGAMSDSSGMFTVYDIPPGSYTLNASYLGYASVDKPIAVEAGDEFAQNFELNEVTVASSQSVVVVASKDVVRRTETSGAHGVGDKKPEGPPVESFAETEAPKSSVEKKAGQANFTLGRDEADRDGKVDAPASDEGALGSANRYQAEQISDDAVARKRKDRAGGELSSPSREPLPSRGVPIPIGGTDPVNGKTFDAMFFENYGVNPFVDPLDDRFATFAVDVDNASYALARSYLQRGVLPPHEAIRVEEFINSFDHHYAPPRHPFMADRRWAPSEHGTFAIHLDAASSPFGNGLALLRVGLKGREVYDHDRKPASLTFVVDVSGSMARENRLGLVKRALFMLLDRMDERDQVALVVYGSNARTILNHTSLENRGWIEDAIRRLIPEGATNAEAGLREGYRMAQRNFQPGYINRVVLCSDGVANVGQTGADDILTVIKNQAQKGIYMTAVGFGMGNYNDVMMEKLANKGDGNYYYVDAIDEARKVFVENLTGTLQTIARDVKIQVEFDPDTVRRYRLMGYENRDVADRDFRNDKIDAGEVGAGHEVTALFEVKLNGKARRNDLATVRIRYEDPETGKVTEEAQTIRVQDIETRFERAEATFRMDAAVAEFSEILRHSYWAKDGSLSQTLGVARDASRELGSPQELDELVQLVDTAWRLWPDAEPPTWRDDIRPQWEPEDDERR